MGEQRSFGRWAGRFTPAITVIILFGVISLLGDMIYETARSANSQYFQLLGVSATTVGVVFGIGEFLGYFLRLFAGIWSDRIHKQWVFMFVGYAMLIAVPLMGLTMNWNFLVVLILMERIGKALRNPAKDTVVSSVAEGQVGVGFAFGLQEALDQIGAFLGPLILTLIFAVTGRRAIGEYQLGYQLLVIPFILLMTVLYRVWKRVTRDNLIPKMKERAFVNEPLKRVFWLYTLFTLVCTLGFVSFSVVGYHAKARDILPDGDITMFYAIAMAVDAVAALLIGKAYDRMKGRTGRKTGGILVMAAMPALTAIMPFLLLGNSRGALIAGMMLFGVVMGAHETVMRSAISDLTPFSKRGTGYGVFNAAYGLALMVGAMFMGKLYDLNLVWLTQLIIVLLEIGAAYLFYRLIKEVGREGAQ